MEMATFRKLFSSKNKVIKICIWRGALEDFEIDATGQANLTDGIQVDNIKVQISLGNASVILSN